MRPCGVSVFISELFIAESLSQVYGILHEFLQKNDCVTAKLGMASYYIFCCCYGYNILWLWIIAEYICYDDGCHLRKFAQNPLRKDLTSTTQKLASLEILVDKMHITGYVDPWCLQNCDARKVTDLSKVSVHRFFITKVMLVHSLLFQVDTQICEQTFSWLSRYAKMTRKKHFLFFVLYICDLHNRRLTQRLHALSD